MNNVNLIGQFRSTIRYTTEKCLSQNILQKMFNNKMFDQKMVNSNIIDQKMLNRKMFVSECLIKKVRPTIFAQEIFVAICTSQKCLSRNFR